MTTREIGARIELAVQSPADLVFSVAAGSAHPLSAEELAIAVDGAPLAVTEVAAPYGTRLHRVQAPVGALTLDYTAAVADRAEPLEQQPLDDIVFLRPSRYCDSDEFTQVARTHFGDATGFDLVRTVRHWMLANIRYAPGNSDTTTDALDVYRSRVGV